MKFTRVALLLFVISLSPCEASTDKDGVPIVDIHGTIVIINDAKALAFSKEWGMPLPQKRMIDVNGKQMPLREFLLTYCQGKFQNETCSRGSLISRIDSSSGPREQLPKGL